MVVSLTNTDPFSYPPVPGLLRRHAPVVFHPRLHNELGGKGDGSVWLAFADGGAEVHFLGDYRAVTLQAADVRLDYSSSFGRHCAREWLGEQGYPTNEDRAEVLAWSVESVRRGGKSLPGVACAWGAYKAYGHPTEGSTRCYRVSEAGSGYACVTTGRYAEWWAGTESRHLRGPETEEAGKALADAALLRLGWALTNDDGTLTLPPLPEPTRG
jgi:hypothetical protein